MVDFPEHQGHEAPDLSPMLHAVEPPDQDASLTIDQVSDPPPMAAAPDRPGPDLPGRVTLLGTGPLLGPGGAGSPAPPGGDGNERQAPAEAAGCGEGEGPLLALTGRVPQAIAAATGRARPLRPGGETRGVRLDPGQAVDVPARPPKRRPSRALPPGMVALFGGVFGLAAIASVLALLIQIDGPHQSFGPPSASRAPSLAEPGGRREPLAAPAGGSAAAAALPSAGARATAAASPAASASSAPEAEPPPPGPWRVAALGGDEGVKLVQGKVGQKSLMDALEDDHVPKAQVFRILKSFEDPRVFDHPRRGHAYVVALEKGSRRVKGFEYQVSPTEIWQAREGEDGRLVGARLDMKIEQRRVARSVVVTSDIRSAVVAAGFDDDIVEALDEALSDRISLSRLGRGATLRIVAQEQTAYGRFSKYSDVEAIEYATPKESKPVRVYHYGGGKSGGYFDERGKAPYKGGFRSPVKLPRITSRFNPKRMHPVLHTIMPHNGIDFGAATGTPIYAVAHGAVAMIGPKGPNGNLVVLEHAGGITTGYAHMSRFAPGLKAGDRVETRQLIGFVGTTGRSTGPHLHFSVKKNGVFVDPLQIFKMDGERVVPKADREAFDAFRGEMDRLLEALPLPDRPPAADPGPDDDDKDDHPDESDAPATAGSAPGAPDKAPAEGPAPEKPAAAAPPTPPPAAPGPRAGDDTTADSAVWRPL